MKKRKGRTTVRMDISVPAELRARVAARRGVNWSAVASAAFAALLAAPAPAKAPGADFRP